MENPLFLREFNFIRSERWNFNFTQTLFGNLWFNYKIVISHIVARIRIALSTLLFIGQWEKWLKFDNFRLSVKDALIKLNDLVDESDPDSDLPNIVHAFQTAEMIRAKHPDLDWFHLTGLIHDLGKVQKGNFVFFPRYKMMPQWQDEFNHKIIPTKEVLHCHLQ